MNLGITVIHCISEDTVTTFIHGRGRQVYANSSLAHSLTRSDDDGARWLWRWQPSTNSESEGGGGRSGQRGSC